MARLLDFFPSLASFFFLVYFICTSSPPSASFLHFEVLPLLILGVLRIFNIKYFLIILGVLRFLLHEVFLL